MVIATWFDWLDSLAKKEGSWAHDLSQKRIGSLDSRSKDEIDNVRLELFAAGGEAVIICVEPERQVRILHNVSVLRIEGADGFTEFHIVGACGARSTESLRVVGDEIWSEGIFNKGRSKVKVPSVDQLVMAESAEGFRSLVGDWQSRSLEDINEQKGAFWLHPRIWACTKKAKLGAGEFAMEILKLFPCEVENVNGMEVKKVSEGQKELEGVLTFLWSVENGFIKGKTSEPQEAVEFDQIASKIRAKKSEGAVEATRTDQGVPGGLSSSTEATIRDTMATIERVQQSILEKQTVDAARKKMSHKLNQGSAELFVYLAARNWMDDDPELTTFSRLLLADKDPTKGIDLFQSEADEGKWKCDISHSSLVQFFTYGFCTKDFELLPKGMSLFMFRPRTQLKPTSAKMNEIIIKNAFGGKPGLDEEGVKVFAKQDLTLPRSLEDLQKQVSSMIKFLNLLTGAGSIASSGYRKFGDIIDEYDMKLSELAEEVEGLWARLAHFADCVFQHFVRKLRRHINNKKENTPVILDARRLLEGRMEDEIAFLFSQLRFGVLPNLPLPKTLRSQKRESAEGNGADNKKPRRAAKEAPDENWKTRNPSPVAEWSLPSASDYGRTYDYTDQTKKEWSMGWPKMPHHDSGEMVFACPRYHSCGQCRRKCKLAHKPSGELTKTEFDKIDPKARAAVASLK